MQRLVLTAALALVLFATVGIAFADLPGSDGGPAERGCAPVLGDAYYVGATNMACSNARRVATKAIQGDDQNSKWKCTGVGTSFGHCHGRDQRRGKIAHWASNH